MEASFADDDAYTIGPGQAMDLVSLREDGWCNCCRDSVPSTDPHRLLVQKAAAILSESVYARGIRSLHCSVAIRSWEKHTCWAATRNDLLRPHGLLPLGTDAGAVPPSAFRDAVGQKYCGPPLPMHTGRPLLLVVLPERGGDTLNTSADAHPSPPPNVDSLHLRCRLASAALWIDEESLDSLTREVVWQLHHVHCTQAVRAACAMLVSSEPNKRHAAAALLSVALSQASHTAATPCLESCAPWLKMLLGLIGTGEVRDDEAAPDGGEVGWEEEQEEKEEKEELEEEEDEEEEVQENGEERELRGAWKGVLSPL